MKVVVAGGTGLLGGVLTARLVAAGHDVVILGRSEGPATRPGVRYVVWKPDGGTGMWAEELDGADAVVNLTGAGIADRRWTTVRKRQLRDSRVLPARSLVAAVRNVTRRPSVFVQGSAVGFYGTDDGSRDVDESFPAGHDFLADLCQEWEAAASPVTALGGRLVTLRSGVVLSRRGGVVARLKLPYLLFAGGPIGRGRQYMSWVHEDDFVAMVSWALVTPSVDGVFNVTSPNPVPNRRFSAALGRALHRPSLFPVPPPLLRLMYGEMAQTMLIEGQRVIPRRALEAGFTFQYPDVESALESVVRSAV